MDGDDEPRQPLDAARAASRARDVELVAQVRAGDGRAFGQLYDAWFDRVFDLVSRIVRSPDVAAEVTQDAFLSAWRRLDSLEDAEAFGGWLLRIARNAAYNRNEKERRSRAVDDHELAVIESIGGGASNAPAGFAVEDRLGRAATPGAALEDNEIVDLVWSAASALPARDVEVLDLQLRHGLTPAEIAQIMGINRNAANQLVHRLRGRLETAIRARVLWRGGEPNCEVLTSRLAHAGVVAFGAEAVRVIERHLPGCASCDERQRTRLRPAALFAATPILVAPVVFKQQAAAALAAAGVPMEGSAFGSSVGAGVGLSGSESGSGSGSGSGATGGTIVGTAVAGTEAFGMGGGGGRDAVTAPVPVIAESRAATSRNARAAVLGIAAVVLALLLLFGAGLWWGGRNGAIDLAAGPGPGSPGTTLASPAPASTDVSTTAPAPSDPTTSVPPPTPAPRPTTTAAPPPTTPPTTAAPTTTRPDLSIVFTLQPSIVASSSWVATGPNAAPAPTLTWRVTPPTAGTVTITGPEGGKPDVVISSEPSGSYVMCPGTRVRGTCSGVTNGAYTYTLTVRGPDGALWETRTQTLTVRVATIS